MIYSSTLQRRVRIIYMITFFCELVKAVGGYFCAVDLIRLAVEFVKFLLKIYIFEVFARQR